MNDKKQDDTNRRLNFMLKNSLQQTRITKMSFYEQNKYKPPHVSQDCGATLRYGGGGGGGTISDSILGGTKHFFLVILYNFKNIGEGGGARAPPAPPTPLSLYSLQILSENFPWL